MVSMKKQQNLDSVSYISILGIFRRFNFLLYVFLVFCTSKPVDEQYPLHKFCEQANVEGVKALLAINFDVNRQDEKGNTPLHHTLMQGFLRNPDQAEIIVGLLIDKHANLELPNNLGYSPFYCAARTNAAIVQKFIDAGANVNIHAGDGFYRPLHVAAEYDYGTLELLIDAGAELNGQNYCGYAAVHRSIDCNQIKNLKKLIAAGADLNLQDIDGRTPFHLLCNVFDGVGRGVGKGIGGGQEYVPLLIESGADLNIADNNGLTPLHQYCKESGRLQSVLEVINSGRANLNIQDGIGNTPLHYVVQRADRDSAQELQALIEAGADPNIINSDNLAPLQIACRHNSIEIAQILIDANASLDIKDEKGDTPLHRATAINSLPLVAALIAAHADINVKNSDGLSPLLLACQRPFREVAQILIDAGADVNVKEKSNRLSPLHYAVKNNCSETAKKLITAGAHINAQDIQGHTPLHFACQSGKEIVQILIGAGADVHARCSKKRTPLHYAIENSKCDVAEILIKNGVNLEEQDKFGASAVHLAARQGNNILRLLLHEGVDLNVCDKNGNTPIFYAVEGDQPDNIATLLDMGAHLDHRNNDGLAPLHFAILHKSNASSDRLIARGADINVPTHDKASINKLGLTPLHLAAYKGIFYIASQLIKKGAHLNVFDEFGQNPLHYALDHSKNKLINLFIDSGINLDDQRYDGVAALHQASYKGNEFIVSKLIDYGAKVDVADNCKKTPLHWALENNQSSVAKLLLTRTQFAPSEILNSSICLMFENTLNKNIFTQISINCLHQLIASGVERSNNKEAIEKLVTFYCKKQFNIAKELFSLVNDTKAGFNTHDESLNDFLTAIEVADNYDSLADNYKQVFEDKAREVLYAVI